MMTHIESCNNKNKKHNSNKKHFQNTFASGWLHNTIAFVGISNWLLETDSQSFEGRCATKGVRHLNR